MLLAFITLLYVKDRLAHAVLRLEGVVFRPKVSHALRESSVARPNRQLMNSPLTRPEIPP